MKNLPKLEMESSREEVICRGEQNDDAGFAVVLFTMAVDSHEAIRSMFPSLRALRVRAGFGRRQSAVCRGKKAQVYNVRMRVPCGLPGDWPAGALGGFRPADSDVRKPLFDCPASEPGFRFPPVRIFGPDQACDSTGIRRTWENALGTGIGARTLTEKVAEIGCVFREKRLTVERVAS